MDLNSTSTNDLSFLELPDQNSNGNNASGERPRCLLCSWFLSRENSRSRVCDPCKSEVREEMRIRLGYSGTRRPPARSLDDDSTPIRMRIFSDTESDFSYSDSNHEESESNISYGAYHHGDIDTVSINIHEGDSDSSVDGHPLFSADIGQSIERRDLDSDSDIDPMHVGNAHWDANDHEVMDNAEFEFGSHINTTGGSDFLTGHRRSDSVDSIESVANLLQRFSESTPTYSVNPLSREERYEAFYMGEPGDYLDAQGFQAFLALVTEANLYRIVDSPASKSFVENLPLIIICEEHQKSGELACAICKDLLTISTKVNQLPCLHLYHPNCILPWLNTQSSCPLCRYELPTDDGNHEIEKRNPDPETVVTEVEGSDDRDDSSSIITDLTETDEAIELERALEDVGPASNASQPSRGRGGWFLFAAAPIVSLVGIVLVLWLGKPLVGGGHGQVGQYYSHRQAIELGHISTSAPRNERGRRWWWF